MSAVGPPRSSMGRRASFLADGRHATLPVVGAAAGRLEPRRADNPPVTTLEPEILTPAGRRWVERWQRPLDLLAVIFLIDMILIWSFPNGSAALQTTLNVIA